MCVILLSDVSITENRNASTYLERILMNSRSDKLTETAEVWVPGVPAVEHPIHGRSVNSSKVQTSFLLGSGADFATVLIMAPPNLFTFHGACSRRDF